MSNIVKSSNQAVSIYSNIELFEQSQRTATALCKSELVPKKYQGNISNTLVAMEVANNMNMSPFTVMNNMEVLMGSPRWSSKFVLSVIRSCGRFTDITIEEKEDDEISNMTAVFYEPQYSNGKKTGTKTINAKLSIKNKYWWIKCKDKSGNVIQGPKVSLEMAFKEGWYTKNGSKWATMPDMMGSYRAASFFGNLYISDLLNGMGTTEEAIDIEPETIETEATVVEDLNQKITPVSEPPVEEPPVDEPPVEDDPEEDTPGNWV
jgi:hypothetical protein